jgi:hypothetical protein
VEARGHGFISVQVSQAILALAVVDVARRSLGRMTFAVGMNAVPALRRGSRQKREEGPCSLVLGPRCLVLA